jgi:hypothetical protein
MKRIIVAVIMLLFMPFSIYSKTYTGFAVRETFTFMQLPSELVGFTFEEKTIKNNQTLFRLWTNTRQKDFVFKFAFELRLDYKSQNAFTNFNQQASLIKKSIKTDLVFFDRNNTEFDFELEQFEINFRAGKFDIQFGRQPISFGTSHFVSVADIIAPFHPGYIDKSYKPGVDAIRFRTGFGLFGEAELIHAFSKNGLQPVTLGRLRNNSADFDYEVVFGRFNQRNIVAISFEGEPEKINFWGEAAIFSIKDNDFVNGSITSDYALSWILGLDKSLGKNWRGTAGFLHQDLGAAKPENLDLSYSAQAFAEGWMHLGGKRYALINFTREMNPTSRLSINGMINVDDKSTLWQPVVSVDTSNNSDLSIYSWLKTGMEPEVRGRKVTIKSDFGSFSSGVGIIFRRFF